MHRWIKLLLALAAIALMAWLIIRIGSFTLGILRSDGVRSGEPDPMFAEEEDDPATMPPELTSEEGKTYQDNSANWDTSVQTPVDKTAGELEDEARSQS